jgi:hypothetical protein
VASIDIAASYTLQIERNTLTDILKGYIERIEIKKITIEILRDCVPRHLGFRAQIHL